MTDRYGGRMKKKLNVLILEDNPSDALLIERSIKEANLSINVKHVETKKDFVDEIKKNSPDLVLSDYRMPDFDGMSALLCVKKYSPQYRLTRV